jgi:hypothetical protein
VENIGMECFSGCSFLSEVVFGKNSKLKEIDVGVFLASGVKSIEVPSSVEKIGIASFSNCKSLSKVSFERNCNLKEICVCAFRGSSLLEIDVPSSVEKIGSYCFYGCESLCDVTFGGSPFIGKKAFDHCPLRYGSVGVNIFEDDVSKREFFAKHAGAFERDRSKFDTVAIDTESENQVAFNVKLWTCLKYKEWIEFE